ncbi:MAG: hypothetical protein ABL930_05520 [Pseudobdellovibrio sp.]
MKTILLPILAIALLTLSAEARRDQKREVKQQSRIGQGVKSGELTKREAKKLRKGQKRVDHMQKKANADGQVSIEERAKIEKAQDKQNALIYKQKHDGQERKNTTQPVPPTATEGSSSQPKE